MLPQGTHEQRHVSVVLLTLGWLRLARGEAALLLSSFLAMVKLAIHWFELMSSLWDVFSVCIAPGDSCCSCFISDRVRLIPEIKALISWSNGLFFPPCFIKQRFVLCWIMLLEKAPHGLAQQLYVEQPQQGKPAEIRCMATMVWPPWRSGHCLVSGDPAFLCHGFAPPPSCSAPNG